MRTMALAITAPASLFFFLACLCSSALAASSPASLSVPPLQWLDITNALAGAPPPPLKDASIGYDDTTRTLIIFGGESSEGFVQSQTYLLNLQSLTWESPTPPNGLSGSPSARSAVVSAHDLAASYRHGHVIIGGKGSNNEALNDVWEFDFISQFWSQVSTTGSSPPPRWGASGGLDIRVSYVNNAAAGTPQNTVYLAGGTNNSEIYSLSDVWQLQLTGTLSSNNAHSVSGTWVSSTIGSLPSFSGQAGTVVQQNIVAAGGCSGTIPTDTNYTCATQDSFVIEVSAQQTLDPTNCAAPRVGGTLVMNGNGASSSYTNQAFLLFGLYNTSQWQDGNGLESGEVDVLDTSTGAWTRVLPSKDPNSGVPASREGAAAVAFTSSLVGSQGSAVSDILVFGGRAPNGTYFNDVWILRAYNSTSSGSLGSGVDANGAGVSMSSLTTCATAISSPTSTGSSQSGGATATKTSSSGGPTSSSKPSANPASSVSLPHKLMSPISLGLVLPALILFRMSSPSVVMHHSSSLSVLPKYLAWITAVVAYGLGIGGIVTSFTSHLHSSSSSSSSPTNTAKRFLASSSTSTTPPPLQSAHAKTALILAILLYGLIPLCYALYNYWPSSLSPFSSDPNKDRVSTPTSEEEDPSDSMRDSTAFQSPSRDSHEKATMMTMVDGGGGGGGGGGRLTPGARSGSVLSQVKRPLSSVSEIGGAEFGLKSNPGSGGGGGGGGSNSGGSNAGGTGGQRKFEVLNRPQRKRHVSTSSFLYGGGGGGGGSEYYQQQQHQRHSIAGRLGAQQAPELDWLQQRRSIGAISELDFINSQALRNSQHVPSTPGTFDAVSTQGLITTPTTQLPDYPPHSPYAHHHYYAHHPEMPTLVNTALHLAFHLVYIALCCVGLIALWQLPSTPGFAVFLAWICLCYIVVCILAWRGRPRESLLSVVFFRLRGSPALPSALLGPHQQPQMAGMTATGVSTPNPPGAHTPHGRGGAMEMDQYPFPMESSNNSGGLWPYMHHRPPYRVATSVGGGGHENTTITSAGSPRTMSREIGGGGDGDDDDEDIDEDTRQQMIEEEMQRREVSIVTVPRRKLRITNPEA